VSFQTAVALADSYSTALIGLVRRGKLKKSDRVLITGASGALGLAAVDIAANVYRAKVIMDAGIISFAVGSASTQ
jgi:NADPH2:quinone reductase